MSPERQQQADELFREAVDLPREDRERFVRDRCGLDAELAEHVLALIARAPRDSGIGLDPTLTPGEPAEEESPPESRIGPYRLIERVGEGGFGVVYRAQQDAPVRRQVALKVIKLGMDTRQVMARFDAERQALAILDHPNIARVIDAGATETGRPFFVMELVTGTPITEYCDQQRMTVRQRVELLEPVCQAVQHAHQKGIIHRDLKPGNVLVSVVDGKAVPKIIDFGIAKAIDQRLTEATLFSLENQMIGTPAYMAPEQAGGATDIDTRADVYSLGVILYELLTGVTPFDVQRLRSAAYHEIQRIVRDVEPPRPSTRLSQIQQLPSVAANRAVDPGRLSQSIRGELDWIVMKCLEKDRARRYETANGLAADLRRYLSDEPVIASPPSRLYRTRKLLRRHKVAFAVATGFVAVLAAATGISLWQAKVALQQRDRADREAAEARSQRNEAERRQRESEALISFINSDVFAGATPERMPDPRVRTEIATRMLHPAAEAAALRLGGEPLVKAAVMNQIGKSLYLLGRAADAEPLLQQSVDLLTAEYGPEHPRSLKALSDYAVAIAELDRRDDAEALHRRVLEARTRILGPEHAETLVSMINLSALLSKMGRAAEAEPLARQVVDIRTRLMGPADLATLDAMQSLAVLLGTLGRPAEAEPLYRQILEVRTQVLGADHHDTVAALGNYGAVQFRLDRADEAEPLLRRAMEAYVRRYGPEHPATMSFQSNYLSMLIQLGRLEEAERLSRELLQSQARLLGEEHTSTIMSMHKLAAVLSQGGRADEAEPLYQRVLEIRSRKLGRDHPNTIMSIHDYAVALVRMERPVEAERYSREAVSRAMSNSTMGVRHQYTLAYLSRYIRTLYTLGRSTAARDLAAHFELTDPTTQPATAPVAATVPPEQSSEIDAFVKRLLDTEPGG